MNYLIRYLEKIKSLINTDYQEEIFQLPLISNLCFLTQINIIDTFFLLKSVSNHPNKLMLIIWVSSSKWIGRRPSLIQVTMMMLVYCQKFSSCKFIWSIVVFFQLGCLFFHQIQFSSWHASFMWIGLSREPNKDDFFKCPGDDEALKVTTDLERWITCIHYNWYYY